MDHARRRHPLAFSNKTVYNVYNKKRRSRDSTEKGGEDTVKKKLQGGLFSAREWTLVCISFALILLSYLLAPALQADRNPLATLTALVGVIGVLYMSRGNVIAHYIFIGYCLMYVAVSCLGAYYGEAIIYLFLMIPIHIASVISWRRQNGGEAVPIRRTDKRELALLIGAAVLLTIPFYFVLRALGTDSLLFSTLSLGTNIIAAMMMLRRNRFYALVFLIDDLFALLLWGAKIAGGVYAFVPTFITFLATAINDAYSFAEWCRRYKNQQKGESDTYEKPMG